MKRVLFAAVLCAFFTLTASAADVTGTWKGSFESPHGNMDATFHFKTDGDKLTGKVAVGPLPEAEITEGKVDGDSISFVAVSNFNGSEIRMNYRGKADKDGIKLSMEVPSMGETFEFLVKKSES